MAKFVYDPSLREAILSIAAKEDFNWPRHRYLKPDANPADSLRRICERLPLRSDAERRENLFGKGTIAYYLLMREREYNRRSMFLPHDLQLLMANILYSRSETAALALEEPDFLPAAALLADAGWKIWLLNFSLLEHTYVNILRDFMPEGSWGELSSAPDDAFFLSVGDSRDNKTDIDRLNKMLMERGREAWALLHWTYLGAQSLNFTRESWIEKGGLKYLLQTPRPRREGFDLYPAIAGFVRGSREDIRAAQIPETGSGPGALDQDEALNLLFGDPIAGKSLDLPRNEPGKDGAWNLTPATWLQKKSGKTMPSRIVLGQRAGLIRAQLKGKKLDDPRDEEIYNEKKGYDIFREVSMTDLDPVSSFLPVDAGRKIAVERQSPWYSAKYALREGDILLPFKGSYGSLGKAGFVPETPEKPTVAAPSICVLRSLDGVDPVWLFWYLNWPSTREALLARAVGGASLTINLKDIGTLPVIDPDPKELVDIHIKQAALLEGLRGVTSIRRRMVENRGDIQKMIEGFEKSRLKDTER